MINLSEKIGWTKVYPYVYKDVETIYTFSDIHGDLDSMIISLRDCAKVIKPRRTDKIATIELDLIKYKELAQTDLSEYKTHCHWEDPLYNGSNYDETLGYEWCGGEAFVVIIGDMIHGYRNSVSINIIDKNGNICRDGEVGNDEVKILLFLNRMCELAKMQNGNIIKLFGNHEHMELHDSFESNGRYLSELTHYKTYAVTETKSVYRSKLFCKENCRYLLSNNLEDEHNINSCGIIAKINDFLFVHGGLTDNEVIHTQFKKSGTVDNPDDIINNINISFNLMLDGIIINPQEKEYIYNILWHRKLSANSNIHNAYYANINGDIKKSLKESPHCKMFYGFLKKLCTDCISLKLVMGHCIQSATSNDEHNYVNVTYRKLVKDINPFTGQVSHIIKTSNETSSNINDHVYMNNTDHAIKNNLPLFGITVDCLNDDDNEHITSSSFKLYKVDTGSSRAFESNDAFSYKHKYIHLLTHDDLIDKLSIHDFLKKIAIFIYARSPSVLKIVEKDQCHMSIIRSGLKNTLTYQERTYIINIKIPELRDMFYKIVDDIDNMNYNAKGGKLNNFNAKINKYMQKIFLLLNIYE
jgi:hypothetical protein